MSTKLAFLWSRVKNAWKSIGVGSRVSLSRFSGILSSLAAFSCPAKSSSKSARGALGECLFGIGDLGRTFFGLLSLRSSSSKPTNFTGRACGFLGLKGESGPNSGINSCSVSGSLCFRIDFFFSGEALGFLNSNGSTINDDLLLPRPVK